jgi:hypothetical protein
MERLKRLDEVSLMEALEISSEDLVERFADRIEDKADTLEQEVEGMWSDDTEEDQDELF